MADERIYSVLSIKPTIQGVCSNFYKPYLSHIFNEVRVYCEIRPDFSINQETAR